MSDVISHFYQFGEFTVDCDQKVLLRNGTPLPLAPKVFDTLVILVENGGRIVEKEALMNRLWPDTFVEEANLTFNIQQLRKALGDHAREPLFIETVARRGYRFIAQVSATSEAQAHENINSHHLEKQIIEIEGNGFRHEALSQPLQKDPTQRFRYILVFSTLIAIAIGGL